MYIYEAINNLGSYYIFESKPNRENENIDELFFCNALAEVKDSNERAFVMAHKGSFKKLPVCSYFEGSYEPPKPKKKVKVRKSRPLTYSLKDKLSSLDIKF